MKIIQNLVESGGPYTINYQAFALDYITVPIPGFDIGEDLPAIQQFSTNNQSLAISADDSPGEFCAVFFNGSALARIQRSNTFVTWLLAENATTKETVFLKWTKWRIEYDVNFSTSNDSVSADPVKLSFSKVGEGDGVGPNLPVLTPFDTTQTVRDN